MEQSMSFPYGEPERCYLAIFTVNIAGTLSSYICGTHDTYEKPQQLINNCQLDTAHAE